jgi:hypothetical protein
VHIFAGFRKWKNSGSVKEKLKPAVVSSKLLSRILTEIVSLYRLNKLFDTKFHQDPFSGSVVVCYQSGRNDGI